MLSVVYHSFFRLMRQYFRYTFLLCIWHLTFTYLLFSVGDKVFLGKYGGLELGLLR